MGVEKFRTEPGLVTAAAGLMVGGEFVVGVTGLELEAALRVWYAATLLLSFNLRLSLFLLLTEGGGKVGGEL